MKRFALAVPAAVVLLLLLAGVAAAADELGYEEIKLNNRTLVEQVNQERAELGRQLLDPKYGPGKVAYRRALAQALERDATGTSEFAHDLEPIVDYLDRNDICWDGVSEVVGFSNTLRTSPPAATADDIVDRWMASDAHRPYIMSAGGDWGGGAWVRSDSGVYFFAFYTINICGI